MRAIRWLCSCSGSILIPSVYCSSFGILLHSIENISTPKPHTRAQGDWSVSEVLSSGAKKSTIYLPSIRDWAGIGRGSPSFALPFAIRIFAGCNCTNYCHGEADWRALSELLPLTVAAWIAPNACASCSIKPIKTLSDILLPQIYNFARYSCRVP